MTISILGIAGSPRRGGNTETILDAVLRGATEAGATTKKVVLTERDVRPCKGCDACQSTHVCVQKDDMAGIVESMKGAGIWVLATPVYWWGPTAQMKAFIDRWYTIPKDTFKGKRVILAVSLGSEGVYADLMIKTFQDIFTYLGVELKVLLVENAHAKTTARGDKKLMDEAYRVGFEACKA